MKKLIVVGLMLLSAAPAFAGRYNPTGVCRSCSNSSACKHCHKNGGRRYSCRRREADAKKEASDKKKEKQKVG